MSDRTTAQLSGFERHADWLWSARRVHDHQVFAKLVQLILARVEEVDGRPLTATPLYRADALAAAIGFPGELWVKDDTSSPSGSHKVRHLVGLALHVMAADPGDERPLAIASCGNAALAAAVVAAAIKRELLVFIPPSAPASVVQRLNDLGARTTICERRAGETGDPCFARFEEAVATGDAVAFCCQGSVTPDTFDGGRTIAWEIVDQLVDHTGGDVPVSIDEMFVQVGGGALATSVRLGMASMVLEGLLVAQPELHVVQTEGAAPLDRALRLVQELAATEDLDNALAVASLDPGSFMWPWEPEPHSIASGIIDDVTYDWYPIVTALLRSGGSSLVVSEQTLRNANDLARAHTQSRVDHTGTAGLAGLIHAMRTNPNPDHWIGRRVVVLFTGESRD